MRIAVVTGNPKPASRTYGVALAVAGTLQAALVPPARSAPKVPSPATPGAPAPLVVDLAEHASALFDSSDAELARLTAEVAAADVAIFASPTDKAAYTGMLKAFLDRYGGDGLAGTVPAVPVMTGGWACRPASRRGSPAPRPGRAGRDRPRPRPLRHRVRHLRPRRRDRQVGRNRRPPDPPRPRSRTALMIVKDPVPLVSIPE